MTKEKIEFYLYNFHDFQREVDEKEIALLELIEKKQQEYEKYPNLSLDKIRVKGGQQNAVMNSVIKIIDKYDRQIKYLKCSIEKNYGEFKKVKAVLPYLDKVEYALIFAKYFKRLRGERLYKELNYSERGYHHAQARTLAKLRKLI